MVSLYHGGDKIKDRGSFGVYHGNQPIKQIYHGSDKVYQYESYNPNQEIVSVTNGNTSSITLKKGVYRLYITGGGGTGGPYYAAGGVWYTTGGGSGSTWEGTFKLTADTAIEAFGCGIDADSYLNIGGVRMITAGGGRKSAYPATGDNGFGGTLTLGSGWSSYVVTTDKSTDGIRGSYGAQGVPNGGTTTSSLEWGEGTTLHTDGAVQYGGVRIVYLRYEV